MKKIIKYLFIFIVFIFFISSIFAYYSYNFFTTPYVAENTFFIVNKGDTFKKVVNNLSENDIINQKNKKLFLYISTILLKNKINIKAGEYLFYKNVTPLQILKQLKNGNVYYRKLTIAEGLSNDTIFKIINNTEGLTGELPTDKDEIPEGIFLPETYLYTYGDSKVSVLNRMKKAMLTFFDEEWSKRSDDLPFKTKQEALSLASIVEKETGLPEERGKVASVFINRLKKGMRLQSDPTVVYSFTKGNKDLERSIRRSDLARLSEYNTYVIKGIPSKPIANPGKDAIKAVLNPEKTNYLYFVATGNGGHNFSKTLKEHNRFVKDYRQNIKNNNNN